MIGDCLVKPGHGFASSRVFEGFGMSDDNVVMVDEETYLNLVAPSFVKLGKHLVDRFIIPVEIFLTKHKC